MIPAYSYFIKPTTMSMNRCLEGMHWYQGLTCWKEGLLWDILFSLGFNVKGEMYIVMATLK